MSKLTKKLLEKYTKLFNNELKQQKEFFTKPEALTMLISASALLIKKYVDPKLSKSDVKKFLQQDKRTKALHSIIKNDISNDMLSKALCVCQLRDAGSTQDIDKIMETSLEKSDLDESINMNKLNTILSLLPVLSAIDLQQLKSLELPNVNVKSMFDYKMTSFNYSLNFVFIEMGDLFSNYEIPSFWRAKYLQKTIRNLYGLIKLEMQEASDHQKEQLNSFLGPLKHVDEILIAVVVAATIYMINRKKLQEKSSESLQEFINVNTCDPIVLTQAIDPTNKPVSFRLNLTCAIEERDDVIVPHTPIQEKHKQFSCETSFVQKEEPVESTESPDLTTIAIIENKKTELFKITVNKENVSQTSILGTIGNKKIYSPVVGVVDEILENKIVIRNIKEADEDYLNVQINSMSEKYQELNYIKLFLKSDYIKTSYPSLLKTSTIDASIINTKTNVSKLYNASINEFKRLDSTYNNKVKQITGKENVEFHSKNETLNLIKKELDSLQTTYYNNIKLLYNTSQNRAKSIKVNSAEFNLFEHYAYTLGIKLNSLENPSPIEIKFRDLINEFTRKRFVLDKYEPLKLARKIYVEIKTALNDDSEIPWFEKMMNVYKDNSYSIDKTKDWLKTLISRNKKLSVSEQKEKTNLIMYMFNLYLNIKNYTDQYKNTLEKSNKRNETIIEATQIEAFMNELWVKYKKLPKEIDDIEKIINDLSGLSTYSIIEYKGEKARLYSITEEETCFPPDEDENLTSRSKYGFDSPLYWLKYCSYASLASVLNPATGWATGLITPSTISLPIIYIPIKAIQTKYGFIVIGLSICGMWVFPWVLMVNYTSNHVTPFLDPTISLKNEVQALKKGLIEQLSKLKKDVIKKMMDETKKELDLIIKKIDTLKIEKQTNRTQKPPKLSSNVDEYTKWSIEKTSIDENLLSTKIEKMKLSRKHLLLNMAYRSGGKAGNVDKGIEASEKLIEKQFDSLEKMLDKIDLILSVLPITMKPYSANFGITLKNMKPIAKIADELDDNVNEGPTNSFVSKFKMKSNDLMSKDYNNIVKNSVANLADYMSALSIAMITLIKKDPFPKYQNLKVTNIHWIKFLYTDFVVEGAKSFGFPI